MSLAFAFLRSLSGRGQGQNMYSGGEADLYSAGVSDVLGALESGYDLESGAVGDRLHRAVGNFRQGRADKLQGRADNSLARIGNNRSGGSGEMQQAAQEVVTQQVGAEIRKTRNKDLYKLYRPIPLVAPAVRADAAVVAISVTPVSKCFAESMVANGLYRIDTLTLAGQGFFPNGAVSTTLFQGANNAILPVNLYLDTVPITGQITNNTGASVYAALDLMTWMQDSAASDRF